MDSLKTLRVDIKALLARAQRNEWMPQFLHATGMGCGDQITDLDAFVALVKGNPAEKDYLDIRPHLSGKALLDLVECLVGVDHRPAGLVLLGMAQELFAPEVPENHPARQPTEKLLEVLKAYLLKEAPAEAYIGEAFRYRSKYGTTISSAGTDADFELLFEAMPSNGLCCPVGEGLWHLTMHWDSFGRYLAGQRDEWRLLDDIDEELDDLELVEGKVAAGREAADNVRSEILDFHRNLLIEGHLDDYDDALAELIDRILPVALGFAQETAPVQA